MAVLHGHHVWDVLHNECTGLQHSADSRKFFVEEVAGVAWVARPDLAESLAWRAAIDDVDVIALRAGRVQAGLVAVCQKAGDIAPVEIYLGKVRGVGAARLRVRLN